MDLIHDTVGDGVFPGLLCVEFQEKLISRAKLADCSCPPSRLDVDRFQMTYAS
jgi:hypothetical protein